VNRPGFIGGCRSWRWSQKPEKQPPTKRYLAELRERAVRMVQEAIEQNNPEQFRGW
jgi:hypothetical protein